MAGTTRQMNQIGSIQTIWQEIEEDKNFVVFSQTFRQYGMTASDCSPPPSLSIRLFQQQIT